MSLCALFTKRNCPAELLSLCSCFLYMTLRIFISNNGNIVSSGCTPRNGIARSHGSSFIYFGKTSILFCIIAIKICIPTKCLQTLTVFLHSPSTLVTSWFFIAIVLCPCDCLIMCAGMHALCYWSCVFRFTCMCVYMYGG